MITDDSGALTTLRNPKLTGHCDGYTVDGDSQTVPYLALVSDTALSNFYVNLTLTQLYEGVTAMSTFYKLKGEFLLYTLSDGTNISSRFLMGCRGDFCG